MKKRILLICFILSFFVSCPQEQEQPIAKEITTPIVVVGETGKDISSVSITVELEKGKFKAVEDGVDAYWFSPTVSGLKYNMKGAVTEGATKLTIVISGMPTSGSTASLDKIIIPKEMFMSASSNVEVNLPKGSCYDIAISGSFSYKIFDLATFADTTAKDESPNKNLTKYFNKTDIAFGDDNSIKRGTNSTNIITFEEGLSRYGYKLAGFNRVRSDGTVSTDVSTVEYKADEVEDSTGKIIIRLKDSDNNKNTSLYAVWEVDPDAWGWTKNSDGSYNKTHDISGYNAETGENAYFPATFNLKKSGIAESNQSKYTDCPYYKEAKVLSNGLKSPGTQTADSTRYSDLDDVTFDYDFAIGEQMVTGYMLDELRKWNIGNGSVESPEKGYELPIEAQGSAPSGNVTKTNNTVGYGTSFETGTDIPNNEKSDPITYVTVSQAIVISNAFTAYYNEKKAGSLGFIPLTFAYIQVGSTDEIKTISNANALVAKFSNVGDCMNYKGNTGFRLPTQNEWTLASRIVPESNYDVSLTGAHTTETGDATRNYMYPQITRSNMWSGANVIASSDTNKTLSDIWVWHFDSVPTDTYTYRTTHGFLKASKDGSINNWTVIDKRPNNIGVYGMSGNVWEWCDSVIGTSGAYRIRGGSFDMEDFYTRVGYLSQGSEYNRFGNRGFRLARTI